MTVVTCGNCEKRKSVVGQERKSTCEISGEPVWGFVQMGTASNRCPLAANEATGEELQKIAEIKEAASGEELQKTAEIKEGSDVVESNGQEQLQPVTTTAAPTTTTPIPVTTAAPQQNQQNQQKHNQQQNHQNRK